MLASRVLSHLATFRKSTYITSHVHAAQTNHKTRPYVHMSRHRSQAKINWNPKNKHIFMHSDTEFARTVTHLVCTAGVATNPDDVRWSKGDLTTITEQPSPNAQQLHQRRHVAASSRSTAAHTDSVLTKPSVPSSRAAARNAQSVTKRMHHQHVHRRVRHLAAPSTRADAVTASPDVVQHSGTENAKHTSA